MDAPWWAPSTIFLHYHDGYELRAIFSFYPRFDSVRFMSEASNPPWSFQSFRWTRTTVIFGGRLELNDRNWVDRLFSFCCFIRRKEGRSTGALGVLFFFWPPSFLVSSLWRGFGIEQSPRMHLTLLLVPGREKKNYPISLLVLTSRFFLASFFLVLTLNGDNEASCDNGRFNAEWTGGENCR